ncbi:hypothetical protein PPYR_08025 [Photinus pyralis]|uniref:Insulin-like domain-containing protein n=1 Tax=Photinus pyralis TaxID=7054 RepID=A0A5N4AS16_PHOPY|nr:hypothetical protein PPYR_08025 [Photinus pyralis]
MNITAKRGKYNIGKRAIHGMARFIPMLLLVLVWLNTAEATDDLLKLLQSRKATRYCGPNLSEVLSLVCRGRYNTPPPVHDIQRRDVSENSAVVEDVDHPYASRAKLVKLIHKIKHSRQRRGVYNECCENPCSYDILVSYCA